MTPPFSGTVLALDTSLHACAVAFGRVEEGRVVDVAGAASHPMTRGHAEAMMPMLDGLRSDLGAAWCVPDRIAVTRGPGSFTGLRVALAAGRALGLAWKRPVFGVGTLAALAASLPGEGGLRIGLADARLGRLYAQGFDGLTPLWEPVLTTAAALAERMGAHEEHAHEKDVHEKDVHEKGVDREAGHEGEWRSAGQLPDGVAVPASHTALGAPSIEAVLALGAVARDEDTPAPLYIRGADAVRPAAQPARAGRRPPAPA